MKLQTYLYLTAIFILFSCTSEKKLAEHDIPFDNPSIAGPINFDLEAIKKRGVLKAIVVSGPTSFFIYRGETMGFEYELLERFADDIGVTLEIVVAKDFSVLGEWLNNGKGDIVAHGFTPTLSRKERFTFSNYLYLTKQVLVQKKPDNWRDLKLHEIDGMLKNDVIELINDTVSVRANSSYKMRLENLMDEIGDVIHIDEVNSNITTDELIGMVSTGEIKYTIADNTLAQMHAYNFKNLDVSVPVSLSQKASWVLRKNATGLSSYLNEWVSKIKNTTDYYVIYNRYYKNKRTIKKHIKSDYFLNNTGKLSPYDDLIKKYAKDLPWDWVLLASQIFQESRFNPNAKSWASAHGLMQIMPSTAKELGVLDTSSPEESIKAGTRYLKQLWNEWKSIPDRNERIKFTLASYNAGINHVKDAVTLIKLNKDGNQNIWDENIEASLLKLTYRKHYTKPGIKYGYVHGIEPISYVKDIYERYNLYNQILEAQ
ncbi:transglycosylase SLT domain-containing protein [Algibacter mikhailovii]|uniref:Lytic transglycosylase F n=1 Tax=Algibacter mikhailovii TaxID=425498 RepID=A0A918QQX8_9FLAO|nr:transporter substrate-binding domain-containing protein [Algibacter mikhailovii]GGZ68236.1 lytic transglycosylase F [Algibacter mikhailovii]